MKTYITGVVTIFVLLVTGCKSGSFKNNTLEKVYHVTAQPLLDNDEIKMAVCEYMLTNVLMLQTVNRAYLPLDEDQARLLQRRLPQFNFQILPSDSYAKFDKNGHTIKVHKMNIHGSVATTEASWNIDHSFEVYEIGLLKTSQWFVTNAVAVRGSIGD